MLASNGHHEIVRLLLLKGAKIAHMDICGNTALHYAAANNFPHCTNELLTNVFVNVMEENEDGKTAYHLAMDNKAQLSQAVIENFISNVIS
jgi:ankyrin repeat family A protein 2